MKQDANACPVRCYSLTVSVFVEILQQVTRERPHLGSKSRDLNPRFGLRGFVVGRSNHLICIGFSIRNGAGTMV